MAKEVDMLHIENVLTVMQFLYMVSVGIAVQHFAASGLRGMYS